MKTAMTTTLTTVLATHVDEGTRPWARMRVHGPCMIFDYHETEQDVMAAIVLCAEKLGDQVHKFQVAAYFPHLDTEEGNLC